MRSKHAITRFWKEPRVQRVRRLLSVPRWYRYATANNRRLPDYIIAGTQKGGTTSLFGYLAGHPQVVVSMVKEVHYFDKNHHRGPNWYRMHFPLATQQNEGKPCGESSPFYMFCPHSPRRIAQLLPRVKILVLLRNPIDRAFSQYHHSKNGGWESLSFEDALDAEAMRTAGERNKLIADGRYNSLKYRRYSYVQRGIYVDQIRELKKHFPRENLLILQSEPFFRNTRTEFDKVLDFLGLDRWQPPKFRNLFSGGYKSKMLPATRDRLRAFYAPHNQRLYAELGENFAWD